MNKKNLLIKFGKKLRLIRKNKGITQEELANLANVHRTYIGMIERGEKNVTLINIAKLADALDIDIKNFFND